MPLVFNGTTIPEVGGSVVFNGTAVNVVNFNGTIIWRRYTGPNSPITITANRTLVAGIDFPAGINVTVCMVGGGGSGAMGEANRAWSAGGGHAGTVVNQTINRAYNTSLPAVIGSGGAGRNGIGLPGHAGTASTFAGLTAGGGAAGVPTSVVTVSAFNGAGASRTTCLGTNTDGTRTQNPSNGYWLSGGQSSGIGKGGNAVYQANAQAGGVGAGGGGSAMAPGWTHISGAGGIGRIVLSW